MIKDILELTGDIIGTVAGIAIAPISIALNVSEHLVKRAVKAGCKTEKEIKKWIDINT